MEILEVVEMRPRYHSCTNAVAIDQLVARLDARACRQRVDHSRRGFRLELAELGASPDGHP